MENAKKTKQLNLNELKVEVLVKGMQVDGVTNINANRCSLTDIEPEIFSDTIKTVSLAHNSLTSLPPTFFQITKLTLCNLSYNSFSSFSGAISSLSKLNDLDLSHNNLTQISLHEFPALRWMNLDDNKLTEIPLPFCETLEELSLGSNKISKIPADGWEESENLRIINLRENSEISTVPNQMLEEGHFDKLDLTHTKVKKKDLQKLEGLEAYVSRRKGRMDIALKFELNVNYNLCGLEDK